MVSSGTVSGDLSTFTGIMNNYNSTFSSVSSSWTGSSFDGISAKVSEFSSSFSSTISNSMQAYASACDLLVQYKTCKKNLETANNNLNAAVSNNDGGNANTFSTDINTIQSEMNNLATQINSLLSQAASSKLDATKISTTTTTGASGTTSGIDWSNDANFKYFNQGGGWKNYRYSSGGSNTMGKSGCGPTSMAMVMASMGYDVNPNVTADWSADHGYHTNGTEEPFFTAYANEMGVGSRVLGASSDNVRKALSNNELVIFHVGNGDFTQNGHFIVGRAYDPTTDKVLIADPNKTRNNKWWSVDRVVGQLKGTEKAWSFYKA